MNYLKKFVIITLLAVWTFPAVSQAAPLPERAPAAPAQTAPVSSTELTPEVLALANMLAGGPTESTDLAAREKQAPNLQDYKGGAVEVYIGSGAALVLIIVLLIILL
jgi:hypothetical protein